MVKNKFFIFEGIDGSGKTSLIQKLKEYLPEELFFFTKEPCGTDIASEIEEILCKTTEKNDYLSQYLAFAMERSYHIKNYVLPSLKIKNVISDRFFYSSLGYHGNYLDTDIIKKIYYLTNHNIIVDIIFYCKIDPKIAIERIEKRKDNNFLDYAYAKKLEYISNTFDHLFNKKNPEKIVILDMTHPVEILAQKVIQKIKSIT